MGTPLATPLAMTRELTCRLAALDGASAEQMEAAIALWDLGDRLSLAAHGVVEFHSEPDEDVEELARRGVPTQFAVTPRGLKVIEQCVAWRRAAHAVAAG